jgi:hypothetical protein
MSVVIRTIGIASAVLWVFLIGFAVSAVFSVKDFQFEFGAMQTTLDSQNEVVFALPVGVVNNGLYSISDFDVSSIMVDDQGLTLASGSTFVPLIGTGQSVNTTHVIRVRLSDLLNGSTRLLFDDVDLRLAETFSMKAAELIPVQASSNMSIQWGAPLYNFALGTPQLSEDASGHGGSSVGVVVPVSFEDHAFFGFNGTLLVRVYNNASVLIGAGQTFFDVSQKSPFRQKLMVDAAMQNVTFTGHYEVFVETPLFSVGPLVFPYA